MRCAAPRSEGPFHGQLLGESVHAAGTVYGGTKLVVAALRTLRGFNRPTDIDKQTRLIAKGGTQSRNKWACQLCITSNRTPPSPPPLYCLLPCHYGRCLRCPAGGVGVQHSLHEPLRRLCSQ
jgi:hypothetical protein